MISIQTFKKYMLVILQCDAAMRFSAMLQAIFQIRKVCLNMTRTRQKKFDS